MINLFYRPVVVCRCRGFVFPYSALRDDERPGNKRRYIFWPAGLNGKYAQVNLFLAEDIFLAGPLSQRLWVPYSLLV